MSLQTWKDEFLPVPVDDTKDWSDLQRLTRDLKKWIGFRPENLAKHAVKLRYGELWNVGVAEYMHIGSTCSLCAKYNVVEDYPDQCSNCPPYRARDGTECDQVLHVELVSPWRSLTHHKNPEPMIHWLTVARDHAAKENEMDKGNRVS